MSEGSVLGIGKYARAERWTMTFRVSMPLPVKYISSVIHLIGAMLALLPDPSQAVSAISGKTKLLPRLTFMHCRESHQFSKHNSEDKWSRYLTHSGAFTTPSALALVKAGTARGCPPQTSASESQVAHAELECPPKPAQTAELQARFDNEESEAVRPAEARPATEAYSTQA